MINSCLKEVNAKFSGEVAPVFLSPFSRGATLKGKNLLLEEQILSFKSRPFLKGFVIQE